MKLLALLVCVAFFALTTVAQGTPEVLARAGGQTWTTADLAPELREAYENLARTVAETRKALLEQQITEILLDLEAKARNVTVERLIETEVEAKVPAPNDTEIQAVYDANRSSIGSRTLEQVRPQIVAFLRREPEQKLYDDFLSTLQKKFKVTLIKDVNAPNLKLTEVLVTVGARPISVQDFENRNKTSLFERKAAVLDDVREALDEMIYAALISAEAKASNLDSSDLIAREITDKVRDYSNEERERLEHELRRRLWTKYKPQILLKEPAAPVLNVSADDDPAKGSPTAPVTVVMFTDFQCPACAATHPVLQRVVSEYPGKVRLVVRDFPLISIHEHAFQAAVAANAAHSQGRFFEYSEILYRNQNALDRDSLIKYAGEAGLNLKQFELDLQSEKYAAEVRKDVTDGKSYGINSTPTIFVNGVKVRHISARGFREAIEKALKP